MEKVSLNNGSIEAYRAAYKDTESIFARLSKSCNLSDAEYWALIMIREGAETQRDICEQLSMSKQTVHSAFKQLIKKDFVRLETMESNLRTKRIILTEHGKAFMKKYIDSMLEIEEKIWYKMSSEERIALTVLTQKYNALLKTEFQNRQLY